MERSLHLVLHGELSQVTSCDTKLLFSTEKSTKEQINFCHTRNPPKLLFSTKRSTHVEVTLCRRNQVCSAGSLPCQHLWKLS
jgi:hypothetical protein